MSRPGPAPYHDMPVSLWMEWEVSRIVVAYPNHCLTSAFLFCRHWIRQYLGGCPCSTPSHYMSQYWIITSRIIVTNFGVILVKAHEFSFGNKLRFQISYVQMLSNILLLGIIFSFWASLFGWYLWNFHIQPFFWGYFCENLIPRG